MLDGNFIVWCRLFLFLVAFFAVIYIMIVFIIPKLVALIDFESLNKNRPYWLIECFLLLALVYPFLTEFIGYIEAWPSCIDDPCVIKQLANINSTEYKMTFYCFLSKYKDYFGTVLAFMLASIAFIREDKSRKEEANKDREKIKKLEQEIEELKQNSIKKKD